MPRTRSLGPLGEVGPLALGCHSLAEHRLSSARELVERAVDLGMRVVDVADVDGIDRGGEGLGGAEEMLGRVLADGRHLRDRVLVATKGGLVPGVPYDSSSRRLRESCEASLRRLGVEVIDLYQVHRPDLFTHPRELAETLSGLVESGRVRAVGVCEHRPSQVEALVSHMDVPLTSVQRELSATRLEPLQDGALDQCMRLGLRPIARHPMVGGRITTGERVRTELAVTLDRLAANHGVERATLALAFVLSFPSLPVAVVPGGSPEQLTEVAAAAEVRLSREEAYDVIQASEGNALA